MSVEGEMHTDEETVLTTPEPTAPVGETKEAAFKRLASYRVQKVLERIRQLGHLSNKNSYDYTPEQIEVIEAAIKEELETTIGRFRGSGKDKPLFTL